MKAIVVRRVVAWMAGVWGGILVGIGFIGAPAGFAVAAAEVAGRSAGRMFAVEAHLSLVIAILMLVLHRVGRRARIDGVERSNLLDPDLLLLLGTLVCTIAGYFVVQPMMAAARAGQGSMSFGALHGLSAAFFGLKAILVMVLSWRLIGQQAGPRPVASPVSREPCV